MAAAMLQYRLCPQLGPRLAFSVDMDICGVANLLRSKLHEGPVASRQLTLGRC